MANQVNRVALRHLQANRGLKESVHEVANMRLDLQRMRAILQSVLDNDCSDVLDKFAAPLAGCGSQTDHDGSSVCRQQRLGRVLLHEPPPSEVFFDHFREAVQAHGLVKTVPYRPLWSGFDLIGARLCCRCPNGIGALPAAYPGRTGWDA